mmetsp:Transcript_34027/g.82320  ORF Transcript_34027/g.82320 Transcript_34027/m.82320 type:complete len:325 (-) Transcript_34027:368-1342(-)
MPSRRLQHRRLLNLLLQIVLRDERNRNRRRILQLRFQIRRRRFLRFASLLWGVHHVQRPHDGIGHYGLFLFRVLQQQYPHGVRRWRDVHRFRGLGRFELSLALIESRVGVFLSHEAQLGVKFFARPHIVTVHRQKHHRIRPDPHDAPHRQSRGADHVHPPVRIQYVPAVARHLADAISRHTDLQVRDVVARRGGVVELAGRSPVRDGGGLGIVPDVEGGVAAVEGGGGDGELEVRRDRERLGSEAQPRLPENDAAAGATSPQHLHPVEGGREKGYRFVVLIPVGDVDRETREGGVGVGVFRKRAQCGVGHQGAVVAVRSSRRRD